MPVYKKHNGKPVVGYKGSELGHTDPIVANVMQWYYQKPDGEMGEPLSLKAENEMLGHMGYKEAKEIRKKSFGTLLAEQDGGLGSSLKAAISKKTKAKITGIKEAFHPLNIAKKLTGGSNWAPAMLGKMFGVDKSKVDYFSGVKSKNTANLQSSDSMDSPEVTECLGYIYKSLKQSTEDKKLADEQKRTRLEEEDSEEETRNQEIVKALTGRVKKEKPYRDEKGRFAKKPTEQKTRTTTNTPKGMEIPKTRTTTNTPSGNFRPNPARTTPTQSTPIIPSSVFKGVAAGAGAAAAASVAAKISRGESRGASKESYTQANIVGKDVNQAQIVKGNIDITTGKPFDKSLNEMTIAEVIDLGKRRYNYYKIPDPKKPGKFIARGGSAMGKYQFIPGTLADSAKKLYGNGWENHPFDNQAQEDINISFIMDNGERLKQAGIPVTDVSLYLMHFFGNPKQTAMVLNGDDNTKMSTILGDFASKQNPSVATMTIAQYKQHLTKKGFDFRIVDLSQTKEVPNQNNVGQKLNDASNNLNNTRADINASNDKAPPVVSSTNVNSQQSQPSQSSPQGDDRSAYQKKAEVKK